MKAYHNVPRVLRTPSQVRNMQLKITIKNDVYHVFWQAKKNQNLMPLEAEQVKLLAV